MAFSMKCTKFALIFCCCYVILVITLNNAIENSEDDEQRCLSKLCRQWTEWSNCSSTCNGGLRQRSRLCPTYAEYCSTKPINDTSICNIGPCPIWSQWSTWSQCSLTCDNGPGLRTRTRACPVSNACGNESIEIDQCRSNMACPIWSEWADWSPCSRTCNRGDRIRRRRCPQNDTCMGSDTQIEPCFDGPCPLVTHWSAWSPCTTTCGGGSKTRSKLTCPQGPPSCPLENEQISCNDQSCPQWNDWQPWMPCSKTCGAGQRVRKRKCPIEYGCVGRIMQLDRIRCNNFQCPTQQPNITTKELR